MRCGREGGSGGTNQPVVFSAYTSQLPGREADSITLMTSEPSWYGSGGGR